MSVDSSVVDADAPAKTRRARNSRGNSLVRTRFAPSPTGFLHVGAFRTALFSWLVAKHSGGDFLLRIEDTDQSRLVPGALESIIRSLQAMGLSYDEGPDAAQIARLDMTKYGTVAPEILPEQGGDFGPYFQSLRLPLYHTHIEHLLTAGKAYYAFETEEELNAQRAAAEARKMPYRYSRRYRDYPLAEARERVKNGEPAVVRFKMPVAGPIRTVDALRGDVFFDAETQDDFIILKSDGFPPYHFAAIVDDYEMQISHVLRGEEWLPSFPKHVCLYEAFGWEQPVWVHVPNVLGPDKKKLSKRHGAKPIIGPVPELKDNKPTGEMLPGLLNQEGYLPEALVNFLALIGWSSADEREVMNRDELIAAFTIDRISLAPGVFDAVKLEWMNGVYIRALSPEELTERCLPFLREAGLVSAEPTADERAYIGRVISLEQERLKRLDEVPELASFFFGELPEYNENSVARWIRKESDSTAAYLTDVVEAFAVLPDWNGDAIEAAVRKAGEKNGRAAGNITHPVRVAVTGRETGPGLFDLIVVLGRERTIARIRHILGTGNQGTGNGA